MRLKRLKRKRRRDSAGAAASAPDRTGLQLLAWMCRRRLALGNPPIHVLRWVIQQLEAAGGGKFSEERYVEWDIKNKLASGYCVFRTGEMLTGDYSSVRHKKEVYAEAEKVIPTGNTTLVASDNAVYDVEKSVAYVRRRYATVDELYIANENAESFVRMMQEQARDAAVFDGRHPRSIVENWGALQSARSTQKA